MITGYFRQYEAICRADPEDPVRSVEEGGFYLHKGRHGLSRCQVMSLNDNGDLDALFIDDGRRAVVSMNELLEFPDPLINFPEFSLTCTMDVKDPGKIPAIYAKLNELAQPSEDLILFAEFLKDDADVDDVIGFEVRLTASRASEAYKEPIVLPHAFN